MNEILPQYFLYSLATLSLACILASICTSLRFTGDAGLPRLIGRQSRHTKRLEFWQHRWGLLCNAARLLLTAATIATSILFYLALKDCDPWFMATALFFLSLFYMLFARIIPHVLSESYADRISLAALPFIGMFALLLYLFVWPLQFIEDHLLRHAMSASDDEDRPSAEDEIKSLIEETDEEDLEECAADLF